MAAGTDGIPAEALKMDPETTAGLDDSIDGEGVGGGKGTRGLEEWIFIQTTKERRLKSMQKLAQNYAPVHPKQNPKPNHSGENQTSRPGWKTSSGTGRIQEKHIMY
ncbi:unnamed protein product [Trichobilharzia regenti]|nr:unnamed protein product [Trichobilharzia regenti]